MKYILPDFYIIVTKCYNTVKYCYNVITSIYIGDTWRRDV